MAVLFPSSVVAVILALPAPIAVTFPNLGVTVAIELSDVENVTV